MTAKMGTKMSRAHKGARHWWAQRISAVVLIPLSGWFTWNIIDRIDDGDFAVRAWLGEFGIAPAMMVYLVMLFFHSQLGLQVIVEDYIASPSMRRIAMLMLYLINILAAAAALYSVARVVYL